MVLGAMGCGNPDVVGQVIQKNLEPVRVAHGGSGWGWRVAAQHIALQCGGGAVAQYRAEMPDIAATGQAGCDFLMAFQTLLGGLHQGLMQRQSQLVWHQLLTQIGLQCRIGKVQLPLLQANQAPGQCGGPHVLRQVRDGHVEKSYELRQSIAADNSVGVLQAGEKLVDRVLR